MPALERIVPNIRQILGGAIGKTIVDITQHDADELDTTGQWYVMIMLSDGGYLKFIIGDEGFSYLLEERETNART